MALVREKALKENLSIITGECGSQLVFLAYVARPFPWTAGGV